MITQPAYTTGDKSIMKREGQSPAARTCCHLVVKQRSSGVYIASDLVMEVLRCIKILIFMFSQICHRAVLITRQVCAAGGGQTRAIYLL